MRRHTGQHRSVAVIADVQIYRCHPRRHPQCLSDVEGLFGIVTVLRSQAGYRRSIRGNAFDGGGPLLSSIFVVGVHVGYIESKKFEQSDILAFAGESRSLIISGSHVATAEGLTWTGAGRSGRFYARRPPRYQGTWNGIVVQAGDVPELERQVDRGFAVRRIKIPISVGVMIDAQVDVERGFEGRYRALELHVHGVTRAAGHGETVGARKTHQRVIVMLTRSELLR